MKSKIFFVVIALFTILFACFAGIGGGYVGYKISTGTALGDIAKQVTQQNVNVVNESSAIINVVKQSSDSVVSIVISKDLPVYENYYSNPNNTDPFYNFNTPQRKQTGTQQQQIGAGSGFVISADGMIITNRHVVDDSSASYTVIFNNGKKYDAKVLAKDNILDIAFLKIDAQRLKPLPLGSSANLQVGQTVIAIGNALGEFSNTVSSGIISGLKRNIVAGDSTGQNPEQLTDVIQTEASINLGNSGGPLLDVNGNVIGVNVAIAQNAQNIGFAIPIDVVKDLLTRLNKDGQIERPMLGVRYQLVTSDIKSQYNLSVDYGAIVLKGSGTNEPGVVPGSAADKAGVKENDVILEINGEKIDAQNPLQSAIQKFKIGDTVDLLVLRQGKQIHLSAKLDKFN